MDIFSAAIDFFVQIGMGIASVFYESSIFILLGFALAGILHEFIPMEYVSRRLGKPGLKSIFLATALGAPLPLCSCGVLPTAATLRRKGASKPAVASFIVSVPETGVDSIAVSYGLMGPIMAIYRPIVAVITALVTGIACLFITRDEFDETDVDTLRELEAHDLDQDQPRGATNQPGNKARNRSRRGSRKFDRWTQRVDRMTTYGFRTVLDDVAFWIVIGLVVTGIMLALLPEDFFSVYLGLDSGILPMLLMAVIGVPLYTCASMSTPIAAGLIATGLSPGAALVFLLAGPATSIASLSIVGKLLGRRSLFAYLLSILITAICAGLVLDWFAADAIREVTVRTFTSADPPGEVILKSICAIIFAGLFVSSLFRKSYREPIRDFRNQWRFIAAGLTQVKRVVYGLTSLALLALIFQVFTVRVNPGQQGMVIRFGEVVDQAMQPGLHMRYPWPIDKVQLTDIGTVRDAYLAQTESEFLTSDENVIALTSVILYRINDSYAFEYQGDKNIDLLRDLASRILGQEILSRPIDEVLTTHRSVVEQAYRTRLARDIEALNQGYELVEARLEYVHAPRSVHDSFRDVSNALEDRQRKMYEAEGTAIQMTTESRGRYEEAISIADGDARAAIEIAEGRAAGFIPVAESFREYPDSGRYRLRLEAIERSFAGPRKFLNTVPSADAIDLWIDPDQNDAIKFNYRD